MTVAPEHLAELLQALDELRRTVVQTVAPPAPHTSAHEHDSGLDGPLIDLLRSTRSVVVGHPQASSQVVQALAAIGRAHAGTADGADLVARLVDSPQVAELRTTWEAMTLNLLDEPTPAGAIPAAWADVALDQITASTLASHAERLRPEGFA